jgi:nucleotide-binding universal stress UspA family protein
MSVILVGVDYSEGARAALAFAHEEARLRGGTLRAVHAWQFGVVDYGGFGGFETSVPGTGDILELRDVAAAALDATVREALRDLDEVNLEQRVIEGTPGAVLVDESRDADLLVVGSRGRGGFAQLLLGSVSQQCAHHAACPVVIVRSRPVAV